MGRPSSAALAVILLLVAATPARAEDFASSAFWSLGHRMGERREDRWIEWQGYMRVRGALFHNLDLDRGLTPSGEPLFPVPLSDPKAQLLTHFDMRLRSDVALYAPFGGVAAKVRLDIIDNLSLGSAPNGPPSSATGQDPAPLLLRFKRAWAEVVTPIGVLAAGRMGNHWGLGILSHGGDCEDCDGGDASDRIAFATALLDHLFAVSFDFTAAGPLTRRRGGTQVVDVDPTDDARTFTFAFMQRRTAEALDRRLAADETTFDYGACASYRWQEKDVPGSYAPGARPSLLTSRQVVARGYQAVASDVWLRVMHPMFRLEAEAAVVWAEWEQATLVPGVLLNDRVEALQWGVALESDVGPLEGFWAVGLDAGVASGDPAFGFGVYQELGDPAARRGDLDGPQAVPPHDLRFDNFRFHPDYHVDQILFREIIGTVTDAAYVKPHLGLTYHGLGPGNLRAEVAAIASFALEATSTPGGERPLGVELDASVAYDSTEGFRITVDYAVLFPLAGLDNPQVGLEARPAQLARLRLGYFF